MRFRGLILACLVLAAGAAGAQTVALPLAANVAALPTCGTTRNGQVYGVRDALTPVVGDVVVGGGAERVVVQCDTSKTGIKWIVVATDEPAAGGGASSFDELASGTNTTAAMVVGTGASLAATGSGTIAATSAATATTASDLTCTNCVGGTEIDETALVVDGDGSGSVAALVVTDDSHAHTGSTLSGIAAADIDTDAIGTDELDDDANTPLAGNFVVVETGAASFDYVAANAGTDITADLEEEAHATEHGLGGTDPVTVTNLASGCTDAQVTGGTAAGTGVECQTDDDVPESGDFAAGVDLEADGSLSADVVAAAEMADADHGDVTWSAGVASVEDDSHAHGATTISGLDAGDTTTGTFADARVDGSLEADEVNPTLGTQTQGNYVSSATASQGLLLTGTEGASLGLIDCAENEILKSTGAGGTSWACAADGGGAGGMPDLVIGWEAANLMPRNASDVIAPLALDQGANGWDVNVRDFDASADFECAGFAIAAGKLADIDTAGTVTFTLEWYAATAASGDVIWFVTEIDRASGENWDTSGNTETAAASAADTTQDETTITTWTETVTNLGWAAGDAVRGEVCRDGNNGSDTLAGDARLLTFSITVPRA